MRWSGILAVAAQRAFADKKKVDVLRDLPVAQQARDGGGESCPPRRCCAQGAGEGHLQRHKVGFS